MEASKRPTGNLATRLAAWGCSLATVGLCASIAGCASNEKASADADDGRVFRTDAHRVRGMLLQDENGLDVRQLVVADEPELFANAMAPWMELTEGGVDEATIDRLRRNGFRVVRVPVEEVDGLIRELGGASMDISSWYGQVVEWRELHALPLGESGRTMAVDGRVRRYRGGELRLMARSWVVPMEHGPRVQLEIVPLHQRGESQYHRLLGESRVEAVPIPSLATHLLLEPGYAYILTCECPQMQWVVKSGDADEGNEKDAASTGQLSSMLGPETQPPTTLGQLMLSSHSGRQSRGMLMFTPRIAAELFPPGEPVATAGKAGQRRR